MNFNMFCMHKIELYVSLRSDIYFGDKELISSLNVNGKDFGFNFIGSTLTRTLIKNFISVGIENVKT